MKSLLDIYRLSAPLYFSTCYRRNLGVRMYLTGSIRSDLLIGVPKNPKRISIQSKGIIGSFSINFLSIVPISPHFLCANISHILLLSGVDIQVRIMILILELRGTSLLLFSVISEISLGSSFEIIRAFSRALALFTAGVGIFS